MNIITKLKEHYGIFLVVVLGLFLRTFDINSIPVGIYSDEAVNGLDAINAMHGQWQWFYEANNGREGLFINIIAVCFKFIGISVFSLKLPSILFGTLSIFGAYLLSNELFKNKRIGLISSLFISVSFWSINFSRISFRANMLPMVLVFSFYFLWKGIRTKRWYDFAIGGLIFGLGTHTYIAFRAAPVIIIMLLIFFLIMRKNFLREYANLFIIFIFFSIISAMPMLYVFFVSHPEYLTSRSTDVSIFNSAVTGNYFARIFLENTGFALAKYNFWGDQNWRHNFPPYGLLDPLTGLAFLAGLIYLLRKSAPVISRWHSRATEQKFEVYFFLVSWFFIMLLPEVVTTKGVPHALRSIGTMPVVFIIAAFATDCFWVKMIQGNYLRQKTTAAIFISALLFVGLFNPIKYFFFWANNPLTTHAFHAETADIEKYIQTLPSGKEFFVSANGERKAPIEFFNFNNTSFHEFTPPEAGLIQPLDKNNFEIIFTNYKENEIQEAVNLKFPNLKLEKHSTKNGMLFYVFK